MVRKVRKGNDDLGKKRIDDEERWRRVVFDIKMLSDKPFHLCYGVLSGYQCMLYMWGLLIGVIWRMFQMKHGFFCRSELILLMCSFVNYMGWGMMYLMFGIFSTWTWGGGKTNDGKLNFWRIGSYGLFLWAVFHRVISC